MYRSQHTDRREPPFLVHMFSASIIRKFIYSTVIRSPNYQSIHQSRLRFNIGDSYSSCLPSPPNIMDAARQVTEPLQGFMSDSFRLVRKCNKPDQKEFMKIATATAVGLGVMGFIGFFVRLIHIPINAILLG
eukprot:Plantae.Rhodophyta-Hildenbrandia_rubra.ctg17070.p1 GENE.Plantae.Rhodophyta-Hildenbrandia_rubra.ctg17070~~Plantae.Rhodophyta-Hildenbrandia_rubra.ctg17070.p1  ORF type:complete len:132 (-),score=7.94 Plantae.Rhodophyta-Hildenbrandia_rubra.ctg17070:375-770(-)